MNPIFTPYDKNIVSPNVERKPKGRKINYDKSIVNLVGKVWQVRGFSKGKIDLTEIKMNQSVHIMDCKDTIIKIPKKVNHILINRCIDTKVEIVSIISCLEIVNGKNIEIKISGSVPCIQVDLTQGLEIKMNSSFAADTRIVNASSVDIFVFLEDLELKYKVPASMFSDQMVSRINSQRKLMTLPTKGMSKEGIVDISKL